MAIALRARKHKIKLAATSVANKLAHLKEALASIEEAQRLQRMCRYLKVNII